MLFSVWEYCNSTLHNVNYRLYKDKKIAIDRAIREEFIIGPIDLPVDINLLFRGSVNTLLARLNNSKMQ